MISHRSWLESGVARTCAAALLMSIGVGGVTGCGESDDGDPLLAVVTGVDADQVVADWWLWALTFPKESNPVDDLTGALCVADAEATTVMLAPGPLDGSASRSCTVPRGTTLVLPLLTSVLYNAPEEDPLTCEEMRAGLAKESFGAAVGQMTVEVGGKTVDASAFQFGRSDCLDVDVSAEAVYGVHAGTHSPLVAAGHLIVLETLRPGDVTLSASVEFLNPASGETLYTQEVIYDLVIE